MPPPPPKGGTGSKRIKKELHVHSVQIFGRMDTIINYKIKFPFRGQGYEFHSSNNRPPQRGQKHIL